MLGMCERLFVKPAHVNSPLSPLTVELSKLSKSRYVESGSGSLMPNK